MKRVVPVIIHHETGEKAQAAGKKNQEYLRYCVAQAKRYNEKVVLLGDKYNRDWCDDWHEANDFITDKWKEFHSVFENYSTYPKTWADGIFKRFFLILEYLERNGYEECVILDSDVLIYLDVSTYEPFLHCKAAAETPSRQDFPGLAPGNGLLWVTSAGFSFFTKQGLIEFTDYCIDMYRNHKEELKVKWDAHRKYGMYGGVSEMSLLHLWVTSLPEGEYLNLLKEDANGAVFDLAFCSSEGYRENQYEFIRRLGIKKIHWENGKPYSYTIEGHQKHTFLCLHFVDITKIFMEGLYKNQTNSVHAQLVTYMLKCRGKLADIKHGNTKLQQRMKLRKEKRSSAS